MIRYEIRTGKFGQYFHDLEEEKDLPLTDVLAALNAPEDDGYKQELAVYIGRAEEHARQADGLRNDLRASNEAGATVSCDLRAKDAEIFVLKTARKQLQGDYASSCEEVQRLTDDRRQILDDYGNVVKEMESLRAERNALAADLQREQDGALSLRLRHGARDDETMFTFLDRLAREKVDLEAANNALRSDLETTERERDEYRGKYQWMVDRVADEKLDGYRELGARAAVAENTLTALEVDYQKVVSAVLRCGPRPASERANGRIEPPWEVINRTCDKLDALRRLPQDFGAPDGEDLETFIRHLADEKRRRVYYQGVVYDVCTIVDGALGQKTVCGTADEPNREVQRAVEELVRRQTPSPDSRCAEVEDKRPAPFVSRKYHHDVVTNQSRVISDLRSQISEAHSGLDAAKVPKTGAVSYKDKPLDLSLAGRVSWLVDEVKEKDRACEQLSDTIKDKEAQISYHDQKMTEIRNALTRAGVEDWEPYPEEEVDAHEASLRKAGRMRSTVQRIELLAQRSTPHEDPRRTAYVAGLERAARRLLRAHDLKNGAAFPKDLVCDGTGAPNAVGHPHTRHGIWDGDNGEAAGRGCEWCHAVQGLRYAIADQAPESEKPTDVVTKAPPHDLIAVEITRAELLEEIDDLLQTCGAWVGGRLDSIRALIAQLKPPPATLSPDMPGGFLMGLGTIRECRVCGCLVAGGPMVCKRCVVAESK